MSLSAILLLGLPVFLFHLSFWKVQTIEVLDNKVVAEDSIKKVAENDMDGSYYFLFPRSNILLFPKAQIIQDIDRTFPRIKSTEIHMKSLTSFTITVSERTPNALWCADVQTGTNDCYFLDEHGLVFDHAPEFTNNVYSAYSGSINGDPIGKTFVSSDEFNHIQSLITSLKALGLEPVSVSTILDGDYSIQLLQGEQILITTRESIEQTLSNLDSVLSDPKLSLKQGSSLTFSSIDLRFGNKVFYKQKGK